MRRAARQMCKRRTGRNSSAPVAIHLHECETSHACRTRGDRIHTSLRPRHHHHHPQTAHAIVPAGCSCCSMSVHVRSTDSMLCIHTITACVLLRFEDGARHPIRTHVTDIAQRNCSSLLSSLDVGAVDCVRTHNHLSLTA